VSSLRLAPGPSPEPILSIADNIGFGARKESRLKRSALVAAVAVVGSAALVASVTLWQRAERRSGPLPTPAANRAWPADEAALALLRGIPLYRAFLSSHALRSARVGADGTLDVVVDVRAVLEPRLAAMGLPGGSELFPETARGTIAIGGPGRPASTPGLTEIWRFNGPSAVLDLLDRTPPVASAASARSAIPGAPSSLVTVRLSPRRLADPALGGDALAPWRDRANFAERLLGHPVRSEIAEDLAGPAVFALYEGEDDTQAEAILAVELQRSDRLSGLLEMLFGLGALTERATVSRYRGVSTGSFVPRAGGAGIALAVDGPILLIATSRARLESAIDARREGAPVPAATAVTAASDASWSAVSSSAFVRHGWARLTRSPDAADDGPIAAMTASLHPEGSSGWRLEGHGPAPAITADPLLPFFRSAWGGRQR